MTRRSTVFAGAAAAAVAALSAAAFAQGPDPGMGHGMMMGRGGMMGPGMGMMGQGMMMGGCPMMGAMMGPMMGTGAGDDKPQAFAEGRIAFLKAELAITEAQQGAWTAYAEAIRKNLGNMQTMHATMGQVMGAKTPGERLDAHVAAMEGRLAALKDMKPALTGLYSALSDDQKKKADTLLTGMGCMM